MNGAEPLQYDFGFPHFRRDRFGPPRRRIGRELILPVGPHRLFFAIIPDSATAALIWALALEFQRRLGLFGSRLKPANLHMTVLFLGGFPVLTDGLVSMARQIGGGIRAAPFEFTFDRTLSFLNRDRYPFVLSGDAGWSEFGLLQQSTWIASALEGKTPISTPHMTLIWGDKLIPAAPLERPVSLAAEEIVLVHSHYGTGRHEHLGRWRLRG